MTSVKVIAKVIEDNTGIETDLPILLTEQGEISSLTDYIISMDTNGYSNSSINATIRTIMLLLDYMEANKDIFSDPKTLFRTFSRRLYEGTIDSEGYDSSGLYWLPRSVTSVNMHIKRLAKFVDWFKDNSLTEFTDYKHGIPSDEKRLQYAAFYYASHRQLLGHLFNGNVSKATTTAHILKGKATLSTQQQDVYCFPEQYFQKFLESGVGGSKKIAVAIRDQLLVLLMHGGGLRESEALLLWVTDVFEQTENPNNALVRIYNEIEGKAPGNRTRSEKTNSRQTYLKIEYGRIPRQRMRGTAHLGWKNKVVDHTEGYIQVQWFPSDFGMLFMKLWKVYLRIRANIECHHPYAFISFHHSNIGKPYTLNAFHQNYISGLKRIGLKPNKKEGLGPHGHRHSYGRRLALSGLSSLIIRRCLHHKSLESQLVYTTQSQQSLTYELDLATQQLEEPKPTMPDLEWSKLTEYGFEDIDPDGYFSGKNPKLVK